MLLVLKEKQTKKNSEVLPNIKNFIKDNFGSHFLFDEIDNEGFLYAYLYKSEKTKKDFLLIFNEEIKKYKRLVLKN